MISKITITLKGSHICQQEGVTQFIPGAASMSPCLLTCLQDQGGGWVTQGAATPVLNRSHYPELSKYTDHHTNTSAVSS